VYIKVVAVETPVVGLSRVFFRGSLFFFRFSFLFSSFFFSFGGLKEIKGKCVAFKGGGMILRRKKLPTKSFLLEQGGFGALLFLFIP